MLWFSDRRSYQRRPRRRGCSQHQRRYDKNFALEKKKHPPIDCSRPDQISFLYRFRRPDSGGETGPAQVRPRSSLFLTLSRSFRRPMNCYMEYHRPNRCIRLISRIRKRKWGSTAAVGKKDDGDEVIEGKTAALKRSASHAIDSGESSSRSEY